MESGVISQVLDLRRSSVRQFLFSPAGRALFVSHDADKHKLYQWDVDSGRLRLVHELPAGFGFDYLAVSADGLRLFASGWAHEAIPSRVLIVDTTTGQHLTDMEIEESVFEARFNSAGDHVWLPIPAWATQAWSIGSMASAFRRSSLPNFRRCGTPVSGGYYNHP